MLSLILPTYNEAENIPELIPSLRTVLIDIDHEIIVVDDDSPDYTWEVAEDLCDQVIRRVGRRGLSTAILEGFVAAKGDVLVVMDADGQHDSSLLPKLYAVVQGGTDVAIGSRHTEGGSTGEWTGIRNLLSRIATRLTHAICRIQVKDPMSGFFAIERDTFFEVLPRLQPKGFKMLLDILVHLPRDTRIEELPFTFGLRTHGQSKLSLRVKLDFLAYLYDISLGPILPLPWVVRIVCAVVLLTMGGLLW